MSPKMLPDITKQYASIQLTDEQLFHYIMFSDKRYERKANRIEVPPTEHDWDDYRAAKDGFEAMQAYEWTEWGGPDTATEVLEPQTKIRYEYLETTEEWLARCRKLREEGVK